jgi:hypothetical protein
LLLFLAQTDLLLLETSPLLDHLHIARGEEPSPNQTCHQE